MQKLSSLTTTSVSVRTLSLREIYGCEVRIISRRALKKQGEDGLWVFGKVEDVLFHPRELRVLGVSIKPAPSSMTVLRRLALGRPAKRAFVRLDDLNLTEDGSAFAITRTVARTSRQEATTVEPGVTWAGTVVYYGMPVATTEARRMGKLSDARFAPATGQLMGIELSSGATADVSLGKRVIPAEKIVGFRPAQHDEELHCIVVKQEAEAECVHEGGLAARAGVVAAVAGTAVGKIQVKAGQVGAKATRKVSKSVTKTLLGSKTAAKAGRNMKGLWSAFSDGYKEGASSDENKTIQ